mgnify:CR=1 FL=1
MADTITIDRAVYDEMRAAMDELADLRAYDRATAALASGEEELIPAAFAERLISGEPPLRVYRELRGMTQAALSDASGVNRVQIVNIEGGDAQGSVQTLRKLADALGVTIDDLVD